MDDDDVELSTLVLLDIRRFDFERRSDDGKLYRNVPIDFKIKFSIRVWGVRFISSNYASRILSTFYNVSEGE